MKIENRIVCLFNHASHYRENIYLKLEEVLGCDFYFGNLTESNIKTVDYSLFKRKVFELKTIHLFKNISWIKKSVLIIFKPYDKYLMIGEYYSLSTWVILFMNKLLGKKTYLWSHGWYGNENCLKKIVKKIYFGLANGVFLYGNYAKELMLKEGFDHNKLHVIFNSLNFDLQIETRNKLRKTDVYNRYFSNNSPTVVFIGRLNEIKKLDFLIEAQKILLDTGKKINVVIIGDGPIRDSLENQISDLELQDLVWLYGKAYDENEIGELLYNADLCVSPGNVGLTAIHSLCYGTPVLTHDNFPNQMPEFEAIEKGVSGDFFMENSMDDLVRKINDWLFKSKMNREEIRDKCFSVVDTKFNPYYQIEVIKKVML